MKRVERDEMPVEIDFSKGTRCLHHIPPGERVRMPVLIEKDVWEHYVARAGRRNVNVSDLVTEVLKRNIEINETVK